MDKNVAIHTQTCRRADRRKVVKVAGRFNISGPCFKDKHFMIEPSRGLFPIIRDLIDIEEWFGVQGPRQSGKTTLLKSLVDWANEEGACYAAYCGLEPLRFDADKGLKGVCSALASALVDSCVPKPEVFANSLGEGGIGGL
jgi:hypothetical protein